MMWSLGEMLGFQLFSEHCILGKFSISEFSYSSQPLIKMGKDSFIGYPSVNIQLQYQKESVQIVLLTIHNSHIVCLHFIWNVSLKPLSTVCQWKYYMRLLIHY